MEFRIVRSSGSTVNADSVWEKSPVNWNNDLFWGEARSIDADGLNEFGSITRHKLQRDILRLRALVMVSSTGRTEVTGRGALVWRKD